MGKLVDHSSLSATLDAANEMRFQGMPLTGSQTRELLSWLDGRCGKPGSYEGMPAPTESDFAAGIRTFTGETVTTGAGIAHLLGEEACRLLCLLARDADEARTVHEKASRGMVARLTAGTADNGIYCCGKCSVALWRHVAAGGFPQLQPSRFLRNAVRALSRERDDKNGWGGRFPFWYTVLALAEMDFVEARAELRHATPRLERALLRPQKGVYAERRMTISKMALTRLGQ